MANKKYQKRLLSKFIQVFLSTFALLMIVIGVGTVMYVIVANKDISTPVDTSDFSDTAYQGDIVVDGEVVPSPLKDKKMTTFAVFGVDKGTYRTDVNMLVFFNHETAEVDILSIPRDTQVKIPDEIYAEITASRSGVDQIVKINEVPAFVSDRNETSVAVLEKSLGVDIDYYINMNLDVFRLIVNTIGDIVVDVPEAMIYEDPAQDLYINIPAGLQPLNGAQAEQFVRYRSGYSNGDIGRIEMQHNFMKAFIEQLLTTKNRLNMVNILGTILLRVDTNFETAVDYLVFLDDIDPSSFTMHMLPGKPDNSARSYYIYDYDATKLLLNDIINEPYLLADEGGNVDQVIDQEPVVDVQPEVIIDVKALKVSVQNGTSRTGFAGQTKEKLSNEGFNVVDASDFENKPVERTRLMVPHQEVFDALAPFFKNPELILRPAMMDEGYQVIVVLGQDDAN